MGKVSDQYECKNGCREALYLGCKIKGKGSGRRRLLYTILHQQAARGAGGDDVHGEGGAEGICYG